MATLWGIHHRPDCGRAIEEGVRAAKGEGITPEETVNSLADDRSSIEQPKVETAADSVKLDEGAPDEGRTADGEADTPAGAGKGTAKPYSYSRPTYGNGQVEQVWENAKDPVAGKVYDPAGQEITWDKYKPRNGQWDMGHIPGEKYSHVHELYMNGTITKKEFLEWYRNPAHYRPELPSTNRGRKFE